MDGKSMIFGDVWDATMEQEAALNELKCGVMGFSTIFTYFHLKTTKISTGPFHSVMQQFHQVG